MYVVNDDRTLSQQYCPMIFAYLGTLTRNSAISGETPLLFKVLSLTKPVNHHFRFPSGAEQECPYRICGQLRIPSKDPQCSVADQRGSEACPRICGK
jgi:hypothetical protein